MLFRGGGGVGVGGGCCNHSPADFALYSVVSSSNRPSSIVGVRSGWVVDYSRLLILIGQHATELH